MGIPLTPAALSVYFLICLLFEKIGFYLSIPIGIDRFEFSAHNVFDPLVIVKLAVRSSLILTALTVMHLGGKVEITALDKA